MLSCLRTDTTLHGLGALYGGSLLSGAWTMVIPTIPVLANYFGISAGAAAQIVTAMAVGRFVGTPISGMLLDRMGVRAVVVGGALVVTVAAFLAALAPVIGGFLAHTFNPGVPFWFYVPVLIFAATYLALAGRETLER